MKKNILLSFLFVVCTAIWVSAQPYYLRSTTAQCDFGNSNASCELSDVGGGIYELVTDFGGAVGRQEFKIYDAGADAWYPPFANAWFNHPGGNMTFRFDTSNGQVEAIENNTPVICAPGDWTNPIFDPNTPMVNTSGNEWCYTVANPGTYNWKPVVCGGFDSWQPINGERSVNSSNWSVVTTSPNEQVCVEYDPNTGRVSLPNPPMGVYLRGSQGLPCDFGSTNPTCELTDPDMDGVFELTYDFGGNVVGRQEFKIYNAATDMWYPGGPNAWYIHNGGSITFKWYSATGEVEAVENDPLTLCAPGQWTGFDPNTPMVDMGNGVFCYNVPTAGTYEWKPVVCGGFDSWQPFNGERSVNSANWTITTNVDGQQFCVTYDIATGRVGAAQIFAVPTMGQWAMIIFTLLMVAMGMVLVRQSQMAYAGAGTKNFSFSLRKLPFEKTGYNKALLISALTMTAVFVLAIAFFGYEMTKADIPGSLLSLPLVAYIVMLLKKNQ
ncbi:MAG: IPTL-CTERM sorting domain-containing protein [Bacteroidota bacterium]